MVSDMKHNCEVCGEVFDRKSPSNICPACLVQPEIAEEVAEVIIESSVTDNLTKAKKK
jgi:predicted  nucleic acid-binding Zn-ribbon protein